MQVTVNSTDGKGIKKLFSRLEKGTVDVGILAGSGKHEGSSFSVAQIGFMHEFGTSTIEERSFIRSTLNGQSKDIKRIARKEYKKVLDGKIDIKRGLGVLGAFTAGLIQKKFTDNDWKQVSDARLLQKTVSGKKGTAPLIDTGQLRQSISFKVDA